MNAIRLLKANGLTRAQIAERSGLTVASIGMYERGDRFVSQRAAQALVKLAESRGIRLLASDFLPEPSAQADTATPLRAAS